VKWGILEVIWNINANVTRIVENYTVGRVWGGVYGVKFERVKKGGQDK
jgi:hypothetical protein